MARRTKKHESSQNTERIERTETRIEPRPEPEVSRPEPEPDIEERYEDGDGSSGEIRPPDDS